MEVKSADLVVGAEYQNRYVANGKRFYRTVTFLGLQFDLMHKSVVTGLRVRLPNGRDVVGAPTTLETR